jgi:hypothetical protein
MSPEKNPLQQSLDEWKLQGPWGEVPVPEQDTRLLAQRVPHRHREYMYDTLVALRSRLCGPLLL